MFVKYNLHSKPGKPMSVKITYTTGKKQVNEWLLPEHGGMATSKTAHAVMQRYNEKCPPTSVELLALLKNQKKPSFITVEKDGKYERVIKVEFENE